MSYLEEAAALLKKAADANEVWAQAGGRDRRDCRTEEANRERHRIADGYTRLAAIEAGICPWPFEDWTTTQERGRADG